MLGADDQRQFDFDFFVPRRRRVVMQHWTRDFAEKRRMTWTPVDAWNRLGVISVAVFYFDDYREVSGSRKQFLTIKVQRLRVNVQMIDECREWMHVTV